MAHPNKTNFRGVLTFYDRASDRPPSGARGHKVFLTGTATERALHSLIGMGINYGDSSHNIREKCGVIMSAEMRDGKVLVSGHVFARDFPEIERIFASSEELGMSYEIADVRVADVDAATWVILDCSFTGAGVLSQKKAAYQGTSFEMETEADAR